LSPSLVKNVKLYSNSTVKNLEHEIASNLIKIMSVGSSSKYGGGIEGLVLKVGSLFAIPLQKMMEHGYFSRLRKVVLTENQLASPLFNTVLLGMRESNFPPLPNLRRIEYYEEFSRKQMALVRNQYWEMFPFEEIVQELIKKAGNLSSIKINGYFFPELSSSSLKSLEVKTGHFFGFVDPLPDRRGKEYDDRNDVIVCRNDKV
jgi:hypothetical protein